MRIFALWIFTFSMFIASESAAQVTIKGTLRSSATGQQVPFANIGIENSPVGTISNMDGTFEIMVPEKYLSDTIIFSALGYTRKSIAVSSVPEGNDLELTLNEQPTMLKNVTVSAARGRPVRTAEFGQRKSNAGSIYVDSVAAGSAMALLIENSSPSTSELVLPYFVTAARLRIAYNNFESFKVRIRFMTVEPKTELPGRDLFEESIIVNSRMRKGWLKFDLSNYNIRIPEPRFFVVFEWLLQESDRTELVEQYREFRRLFPRSVTTDTLVVDGETVSFNRYQGFRAGTSFGSLSNKVDASNHKTYYRNNSYGKWRRSTFALAAVVRVVNYQ